MNDRVLTAEDEPLATLLQNIRRTTKKAVRLTADYRPPLNGERYLTDREVAERLKVSRRTLQEWRTNGQIAYITLGGKVLYRESEIQQMMEKYHQKAWQ